MIKLNTDQRETLLSCKGIDGGKEKFFQLLREYYKNDDKTLAEIENLHEMFLSLYTIGFPAAEAKTRSMYYSYMDAFLAKIGYNTN